MFASSSSVYGDHPALPKVEDRIGKLLSPYAATKRTDEIYAQVFHEAYGLGTIGLRYFNVFGRRQDPDGVYAAVIPRWIAAMVAGKPCVIFGDGSTSRDFCYVDNVVQANLLAATASDPTVTGTVYNCGCNGRTDLKELFAMIRDNLAKDHPELADAQPVFEAPAPRRHRALAGVDREDHRGARLRADASGRRRHGRDRRVVRAAPLEEVVS